MKKRGQITNFIIIGVIIVVLAIALFFILRAPEPEVEEQLDLTEKSIAVKTYVDSCIDSTANTGLLLMGLQGGYLYAPENSISTQYSRVPFYYDNGNKTVPTTQDMEEELAGYLDLYLNDCVQDFAGFDVSVYSIDAPENPVTEVIIDSEKGITVSVDYLVNITAEGRTQEIAEFSREYNYALGKLYAAANLLMAKITENPEYIPISYMDSISTEEEIEVDALSYGTSQVVYVLQDPNSLVEGEALLFLFATKINIENTAPVIEVETLSATVGQEFAYAVKATDADDDQLLYSADTELFEIDPLTGEIIFTPESAGIYSINVTVYDGQEAVSQQFSLTII